MDGKTPDDGHGVGVEMRSPKAVSPLDLEPIKPYLKRVAADIRRSRARTANRVAMTLVYAIVGSLPLYVVAAAVVGSADVDTLTRIFDKWYSIVSPLVGTAIGTLFGIAIARTGPERAGV